MCRSEFIRLLEAINYKAKLTREELFDRGYVHNIDDPFNVLKYEGDYVYIRAITNGNETTFEILPERTLINIEMERIYAIGILAKLLYYAKDDRDKELILKEIDEQLKFSLGDC